MNVKWNNFFALVFLIFLFVILLKGWNQIGLFLSGMGNIAPGHSTDQQVMGLLAFGLVMVLIAAIVKILTQRNP